jgi:hypothetical protein
MKENTEKPPIPDLFNYRSKSQLIQDFLLPKAKNLHPWGARVFIEIMRINDIKRMLEY